ncbi:MAG: hypothetical protein ACK5N8_01660 [Alphaproteobacteria bacterium]
MKILKLVFSLFLFCAFCSTAKAETKTIHVNVALCDNIHQGIYPVPTKLGNGDDPHNNLYWGAMYGIKTYFKNSKDWTFIREEKDVSSSILRRAIFKHKNSDTWMIADAYQGKRIKESIQTFLEYSAGQKPMEISVDEKTISIGGNADILAFVGHNGLMDFSITQIPQSKIDKKRETIILACYSKSYFHNIIPQTGATPLIWTNGKMAPEGYVLKAALNSWIEGKSTQEIKTQTGLAYAKYQKISQKAGISLFKNE